MNALVTGASSGIGKEMVQLLSQRGYHIVMVARREDRMKQVATDLPYGATIIAQDLSEAGAAQRLFDDCQARQLEIDVLVNNAGFGKLEAHTSIDPDQIERMNNLNITCLASLCRLFGERMKARNAGCILNVGSTASYLPLPYLANYAASKAFVNSFTRALRTELKPHGVQVSLLNPGPTATEFGSRAQKNGDFISKSPGTMSSEEVAQSGVLGLFADHAEIVPGPLNQAIPLIVRLLPKSLVIRVAGNWLQSELEKE